MQWFGTNTDVDELNAAEEALRESQARLEKVLEAETVGVNVLWDLTTGCMTGANDTFLNMMGYSRCEVEAGELTWQKLTPPEYHEASLAEIAKFQATGRVGPYEKVVFTQRQHSAVGSSSQVARSAEIPAWNSAWTFPAKESRGGASRERGAA